MILLTFPITQKVKTFQDYRDRITHVRVIEN